MTRSVFVIGSTARIASSWRRSPRRQPQPLADVATGLRSRTRHRVRRGPAAQRQPRASFHGASLPRRHPPKNICSECPDACGRAECSSVALDDAAQELSGWRRGAFPTSSRARNDLFSTGVHCAGAPTSTPAPARVHPEGRGPTFRRPGVASAGRLPLEAICPERANRTTRAGLPPGHRLRRNRRVT